MPGAEAQCRKQARESEGLVTNWAKALPNPICVQTSSARPRLYRLSLNKLATPVAMANGSP